MKRRELIALLGGGLPLGRMSAVCEKLTSHPKRAE
jgi:hypothetical protein